MHLLVVLALCGIALSFECGPSCRCDEDAEKPLPFNVRAICTGNGLRDVPIFPPELARRIYILGLARNLISSLSFEDVKDFENLQVLDLRDQISCIVETEPTKFPKHLQVYADRCKEKGSTPNLNLKDELLRKLKKQLLGLAPVFVQPALRPPPFLHWQNVTTNSTTNSTANITDAHPSTMAPSVLDRNRAGQVMNILERFRQALVEGGHTTLALIIYAIITTISIVVVLTVLYYRKCKPRCRTVTRANPVESLHLANLELDRILSSSGESFPPPPPPEPAVLNMESVSDTSSDELFSAGKVCCHRNPVKQHEA